MKFGQIIDMKDEHKEKGAGLYLPMLISADKVKVNVAIPVWKHSHQYQEVILALYHQNNQLQEKI